MIELNKNYHESNLETMSKMPDGFVDLTVTSPPYDGLRTELATNEFGLDTEQALMNMLERDFCTAANNNIIEDLKK